MKNVTRTSPFTQRTHTMALDITDEQIMDYDLGGALIQEAFPNLTPSEREFYKTGITESEWNDAFQDEEDYENDIEIGEAYEENDHDDMFDIESAMGSAGFGTDEYYGDSLDGNGDEY